MPPAIGRNRDPRGLSEKILLWFLRLRSPLLALLLTEMEESRDELSLLQEESV